jgi:hypothetical protein
VETYSNVVNNEPGLPGLPVRGFPLSGLLLLPIVLRRRLRAKLGTPLFAFLLLAGSLAATATLSGCGSGIVGFVHNMSVQASSGGQQQAVPVILTIK